MRISDEYLALNVQMHEEKVNYGATGHGKGEEVFKVAMAAGIKEILDYGCGKQTLNMSLPQYVVRGYDPAIPFLAKEPKPHDMLVCTDVLEHVEPEYIDAVLDHMESLTNLVGFISVATVPALKTLPDGRNAHISIHDGDWWQSKIGEYFKVAAVGDEKNGRTFVVEKRD